MKKSFNLFSVIILLVFGVASSASAVVLTFDDVTSNTNDPIYDGYGGFDWTNTWVVDSGNYVGPPDLMGSGYQNGIVSPDYVAYNGFGDSILISDGLFDFNSVYMTAAWREGLHVDVIGSVGGVDAYTQTIVLDPWGPTEFVFNYFGIDTLAFVSYGGITVDRFGPDGAQFVMDNFTVNAPVPEPASMLLLGTGLVGMAGIGRKKMLHKK